jgi:hypothetical protein
VEYAQVPELRPSAKFRLDGSIDPFCFLFATQDSLYAISGEKIIRLNHKGKEMAPLPLQSLKNSTPRSLFVDGDQLYITDLWNSRILIFSLSTLQICGKISIFTWDSDTMNQPGPLGIYIYENQIFITCYNGSKTTPVLQIYEKPSGQFVKGWGERGHGKEQLDYGRSLVVSENQIFVTDTNNNRIQIFDVEGNHQGCWIKFHRPFNIACFYDSIIVSDERQCSVREKRNGNILYILYGMRESAISLFGDTLFVCNGVSLDLFTTTTTTTTTRKKKRKRMNLCG